MPRYDITPASKPRMTQQDKWKKRPCVLAYYAFKDECRLKGVKLDDTFGVLFRIPMPSSWSAKKKAEMDGMAHKQKPDIDNLLKGLMDACLDEDSHVSMVLACKVWSYKGSIEISEIKI